MRLRTFTAPDMQAAMKMVRAELGDEAIIIATEGGNGKKSISVTAAIDLKEEERETRDETKELLAPRSSSLAVSDIRFEIQNILRFHNVPELFVAKMMQKATDTDIQGILGLHRISKSSNPANLERLALEKMLGNYFAFEPLQYETSHRRVMLLGAPGIGKTLTIAKIAARIAMEKHPLAVFTTDNKRAGGVEQLRAFTDILKVPLKVTASRDELAQALSRVEPRTHVLIDTAGCNPYDRAELQELRSFATLDGIRPVLVMAAGADSAEAIDAAEVFTTIPVTRMLVTRADTARRFGGIISAAAAHGLGFCNVNGSGSIVDPLEPLDASSLAQLLLRYKQLS